MVLKLKGLKSVALRLLDTQALIKKISANIKPLDNSLTLERKHLGHLQREEKVLKTQIEHWGKDRPITLVQFTVGKTTDSIYYPTTDGDELKVLIQRDYGDLIPTTITKLLTGVKYKSK